MGLDTRSVWRVLVCVCLAGTAAPGRAALNGDYLNKVELRLPSPHEPWGRPCARGKLKVLFITSLIGAPRDVIELAQRFSMDFTVFTVLGSTMQNKPIGGDDEYFARVEGTSTKAKTDELLAKLSQRPDVIVLGNIDPAKLPGECQAKLHELVRDGTGLVRISYELDFRAGAEAAPTLSPLAAAAPGAQAPAPAPIPIEPLPAPSAVRSSLPYTGLRDFQERAAGHRKWTPAKPIPIAEAFEQSVQAARYGKGRVIGFSYVESATDSYYYWSKVALVAGAPDALDTPIQYDYYLRAAAEAVLWAGKRDSRFAVTFAQPEGVTLARRGTKGRRLAFTVTPRAGAPASFTAVARLRDALGTLLLEKTFPGGGGPLGAGVVLPQLGAGTHYLEVIVASKAGKETWPTQSFQVSDPGRITALSVSPRGIPAGRPVRARVTLAAPPPRGAWATALVLDAFDRVAAWRDVPLAPNQLEQQIEVPYPYPVSAGNTLLVTLKDAAGVLDNAWADFFTHRTNEYERFPSVIWGGGGGCYTDRLMLRNLRRAFFTSILGDPMVNRCDFTTVPRATYLQLHATKDGRTLNWLMKPEVVDPATDASIYNPAVQKELARQMKVCVDRYADKGVFVYDLGDENGFSYEGGSGPFEVVAFREFLRTRYAGDLAKLNALWGTRYAAWDEIIPVSPADAMREWRVAPYVDRCLFNEEAYAEIHRYAAAQVRNLDPDAKVGAEGSLPGDLERTIANLEFWSPYEDRLSSCLQRSVEAARPSAAAQGARPAPLVSGTWWGGYVARGSHRVPRDPVEGGADLWRQVLSGTANSNWWFMLDNVEGMINPDLSFADYFLTGSLPYLREICDGIGQQLNETALDESGVYVYYSHPSIHAATAQRWLLGRPEVNADAALGILETLGVQPAMITPRQVLAGRLDPVRVKLLIIPAVYVLSPEEARGIEAYVRAGGRVIADTAPGILGPHGETQDAGSLDELFGVTRKPPGPVIGPEFHAELADHAPNDVGNERHLYQARYHQPLGDWFTLGYLVDRATKTWQIWQDGELKHAENISPLESVSSNQPLGLGFNPGTEGFGGGYDNDFFPWQGDVAEILIYRSASEEQRQAVDAYLQQKYRLGGPANGPTAPPPGMVLWLKADAIAAKDGDPVATWSDASGRGHDAEALSKTNRPLYGAQGLSGMPTVRFPGTDKRCGPGYGPNLHRPEDVPAFSIANHPDLQFGTDSFAIYVLARCEFVLFHGGLVGPPTFLLGNQAVAWRGGGGDLKTLKLYVRADDELRAPLETLGMRFAAVRRDPAVRARPGVEFTGTPEVPMMIAHAVEKGQTVLMNFDLGSAQGSLAPETKEAWLNWWLEQVAAAGVTLPVTLEGTEGRVTRFTAPGLELVGVFQPKRGTVGQAVLRLGGAPREVYDVIAGKYLGLVSFVQFDPRQRRSRLYALLPQKAPLPKLSAVGCTLGGAIACTVDLGAQVPKGQRRVLRIETIDASGHERLDLRRYPRITARQATAAVPVAFNDAPGLWRIRAVDVVTGQSASATVKVVAGKPAPRLPGPWACDVGIYPVPTRPSVPSGVLESGQAPMQSPRPAVQVAGTPPR